MMDAATGPYAEVWVVRHHTMYRELKNRLPWSRMPDEVSSFSSVSFNMSGEPLTGEGGDFRFLEINKVLQNQFGGGGDPTTQKLENACVNYNNFQIL